LMPPSTDDGVYSHHQSQNRNSSKRQRTYSSRAFVFPAQSSTSRKRSHSVPETPQQLQQQQLEPHLSGIHSLTRIMVDLLRMINPVPPLPLSSPVKLQPARESTMSTTYSPAHRPYQQRKYQRPSYYYTQRRQTLPTRNESHESEEVFGDDDAPIPADKAAAAVADLSDVQSNNDTSTMMLNSSEQKQLLPRLPSPIDNASLASSDSIPTRSATDEQPFYEAPVNEDVVATASDVVPGTPAAHATN
jgi:hypothetical protein